MNKTPDPVEVVRDKVIPAAEELVASVAERVAPFAKEAVEQASPVAHAAADATVALVHAAAEKVGPLTQQAVEAVLPLAQQTRAAVTPYAQQAAEAVGSSAGKVGPLAQQAAEAVAPYAALVREQGLKTGQELVGRLEPAYGAALGALSGAKDRVTTDVLPAVGAAAASAAASASPLVSAATDRGKALVGLGKADDVVEVAPPKKKRGWFTTVAVVAAAAGATYVVVRRLVGDRGSQWQSARPTTPAPTTEAPHGVSTVAEAGSDQQTGAAQDTHGAVAPDSGVAEASTVSYYGMGMPEGGAGAGKAVGTDEDASAVAATVRTTDLVADSDENVAPGSTAAASGGTSSRVTGSGGSGTAFASEAGATGHDDEPTSPYSEERVETELQTVEEQVYEEPEDAVLAEQDQAAGVGPDAHAERYLDIPGVYVGVEPPEGYTIKGNERSMSYHLPDSNSYGRTIAEIWFLSEESAQQAGFSRSQN